jgi:hypothetical protein
MPPEAPTEGAKTKLSKRFGQNFRIKRQSKFSSPYCLKLRTSTSGLLILAKLKANK